MKTKQTKTKAPKMKAVKEPSQESVAISMLEMEIKMLYKKLYTHADRLDKLERGGFFKRLITKFKSHG